MKDNCGWFRVENRKWSGSGTIGVTHLAPESNCHHTFLCYLLRTIPEDTVELCRLNLGLWHENKLRTSVANYDNWTCRSRVAKCSGAWAEKSCTENAFSQLRQTLRKIASVSCRISDAPSAPAHDQTTISFVRNAFRFDGPSEGLHTFRNKYFRSPWESLIIVMVSTLVSAWKTNKVSNESGFGLYDMEHIYINNRSSTAEWTREHMELRIRTVFSSLPCSLCREARCITIFSYIYIHDHNNFRTIIQIEYEIARTQSKLCLIK